MTVGTARYGQAAEPSVVRVHFAWLKSKNRFVSGMVSDALP